MSKPRNQIDDVIELINAIGYVLAIVREIVVTLQTTSNQEQYEQESQGTEPNPRVRYF